MNTASRLEIVKSVFSTAEAYRLRLTRRCGGGPPKSSRPKLDTFRSCPRVLGCADAATDFRPLDLGKKRKRYVLSGS